TSVNVYPTYSSGLSLMLFVTRLTGKDFITSSTTADLTPTGLKSEVLLVLKVPSPLPKWIFVKKVLSEHNREYILFNTMFSAIPFCFSSFVSLFLTSMINRLWILAPTSTFIFSPLLWINYANEFKVKNHIRL